MSHKVGKQLRRNMRWRHHLQHIVPQQTCDVLHWRHNIGPLLVQCRVRGHPGRLSIKGYLMHLFLDPEGALLQPLQDAHGIGIVLLRAPQQPCQGIQAGPQRIIGVMHVRDELPLQVTRLGKAEQLRRVLRCRDDLGIDSPSRQDDIAGNGDSTFELLDGRFSEWVDDRVRQWRRHNWNRHTPSLQTGQQTRPWKHTEHSPDDFHAVLFTRSAPYCGSPQSKGNQGLPPGLRSPSRTSSMALAHSFTGPWGTSGVHPYQYPVLQCRTTFDEHPLERPIVLFWNTRSDGQLCLVVRTVLSLDLPPPSDAVLRVTLYRNLLLQPLLERYPALDQQRLECPIIFRRHTGRNCFGGALLLTPGRHSPLPLLDNRLVALLTILQYVCTSCNPIRLPLQGMPSGSPRHGSLTPRSPIPGGAFLGFRQGELVIITTPGIDDHVRHLVAEQREVRVVYNTDKAQPTPDIGLRASIVDVDRREHVCQPCGPQCLEGHLTQCPPIGPTRCLDNMPPKPPATQAPGVVIQQVMQPKGPQGFLALQIYPEGPFGIPQQSQEIIQFAGEAIGKGRLQIRGVGPHCLPPGHHMAQGRRIRDGEYRREGGQDRCCHGIAPSALQRRTGGARPGGHTLPGRSARSGTITISRRQSNARYVVGHTAPKWDALWKRRRSGQGEAPRYTQSASWQHAWRKRAEGRARLLSDGGGHVVRKVWKSAANLCLCPRTSDGRRRVRWTSDTTSRACKYSKPRGAKRWTSVIATSRMVRARTRVSRRLEVSML